MKHQRAKEKKGREKMEKFIMEALFSGEIKPWRTQPSYTQKHLYRKDRIKEEQEYFKERLSPEDWKRFEGLEHLYMQEAYEEETENHAYGFTLATLLMMEVFGRRDQVMG